MPSKDLFKTKSNNVTINSKQEEFVLINHDQKSSEIEITTSETSLYPGQIIPFKSDITEKKVEQPNINEEGELKDDDEIIQNDTEDNKMQTSESKTVQLSEHIQLNKDKNANDCVLLTVHNSSNQIIKVGSHYNFIEANKALQFERSASFGMRLNIPSGDVVTFEPKSTKIVPLIKISGLNTVKGSNNLTDGVISDENLKKAIKKISKKAFGNKLQQELSPNEIDLVNKEFNIQMPKSCSIELPRHVYIKKY